MFKKARNLEFEEAAKLRDDIERLKQIELGLGRRSRIGRKSLEYRDFACVHMQCSGMVPDPHGRHVAQW